MKSRCRPTVVLALLWAIYFHPLLLSPGRVLYSDYSDFLAEHLPAKLFLNREWNETGELPLWNPYHFCGTPFVHDIQVGCFYPPYAAMYVVPERAVGAALSWVIALHVLAAGIFTFIYVRSHGVGEVGSLVAAVGFMLSAKWMTHLLLAGHSIAVGLAWLPLVLLGLERASRDARIGPAIGAGVAFALLVLGTHPQWTFYAGVFAIAWTLPAERSRHALARWLGCGAIAVVVATLLCAVQLLPTMEAAGQSARTVGLESTQSLKVGLATLFGSIGPSAAYDPPASWESRALFGAFWLTAALAAPLVAPPPTRWWFFVLVGLLAFSVGGAVLVEWLPGFRLFRIPSRMLLVATFPLAVLAGLTTDALIRTGWGLAERSGLRRVALGVLLFAVLPSLSCFALMAQRQPAPIWKAFVHYWIVVAAGVPVMIWLVFPRGPGSPRIRTAAWLGLLLAELLAPTFLFPETLRQSMIYPESETVRFFAEHAKPGAARAMDVDMGSSPHDRLAVMGIGSPEALVYRIETPRGYNPLDVRHYREFIGFIVDHDEPLLALSPVAQPIVPNFEIANPRLFDLLNVSLLAREETQPIDAALWTKVGEDARPPPVPALPPNPPMRLPPHAIYQYRTTLPRAIVVPHAAAMPAGRELESLKVCDFRSTVLLTTSEPLPPDGTGPARAAVVAEYRANRVVVDLQGGGGGFLVLADVWFPGWRCRVDGVDVPIHRANHAFRAVAIPDGAKEAAFTFEPRSYRIGWWLSAISLGVLIVFRAAMLVRRSIRR